MKKLLFIAFAFIFFGCEAQTPIKGINEAYTAIDNEVSKIDHVANVGGNGLYYLESALANIGGNPIVAQMQPIIKNSGIVVEHGIRPDGKLQGKVLKRTTNGLQLFFFNPAKRWEELKIGKAEFTSSFNPSTGIVEIPNPQGFANLDVFSLLIVHELAHAQFGGSEAMPYVFEIMVLIQYHWGRDVLNKGVTKYRTNGFDKDFMSYIDSLCPKGSSLEKSALSGFLMIASAIMVERPTTEEELNILFKGFNKMLSSNKYQKYKTH